MPLARSYPVWEHSVVLSSPHKPQGTKAVLIIEKTDKFEYLYKIVVEGIPLEGSGSRQFVPAPASTRPGAPPAIRYRREHVIKKTRHGKNKAVVTWWFTVEDKSHIVKLEHGHFGMLLFKSLSTNINPFTEREPERTRVHHLRHCLHAYRGKTQNHLGR